jgi:hypothetical protein
MWRDKEKQKMSKEGEDGTDRDVKIVFIIDGRCIGF